MADLLALAERVEREEPSDRLEYEIAVAVLGYAPASPFCCLTSLDAAVMLVGPHWYTLARGRLTPDEPLYGAIIYLAKLGDATELGSAETDHGVAAALTAACLRARATLSKDKPHA